MALSASFIGRATGSNVTSLAISTSRVAADQKIFAAVSMNLAGFDNVLDSAGNIYNQVAGSQSGVGAFMMEAVNSILLPNGSTITLDNTVSGNPFSGTIAAFSVSGLTASNVNGSSAGQGNDNAPLVALDGVPANDWCLAFAAVAAGSNVGFTQAAGWSNPGNFNTQTTTGFSTFAGIFQATAGGHVAWNPTLGSAADWAALMVALSP